MDLHSLGFWAFLAPVALFFKQGREFLKYLVSLFWKTREIPYDFSLVLYELLRKESFVFNFDNYKLDQTNFYSVSEDRFVQTLTKLYCRELILYKKFIPVFVAPEPGGIKISYFRFSLDFEKKLREATEILFRRIKNNQRPDNFYIEEFKGKSEKLLEFAKLESGSSNAPPSSSTPSSKDSIFSIYRLVDTKYFEPLFYDPSDLKWSAPKTAKSKYVFTERGLEILQTVKRWLELKNWYESHNINYRRGIALYGAPGSGKSSLILEIAKECKIPLLSFSLSTMDNSEFDKFLEGLPTSQSILLFEDIDLIFEGRKSLLNTEHCRGITFDHFINKLSGVKSINDKFIFITTNKIESLDAALLRPGRCDEVIELPMMNIDEKRRVAEIMIEDQELIEIALERGIGTSNAEFENLCVELSTEFMWKNKK